MVVWFEGGLGGGDDAKGREGGGREGKKVGEEVVWER